MTAPAAGDRVEAPIVLDELDLFVTMRCNLACDFCSVSANEYEHEELPLERLLALIAEARSLGLTELHFSGGEPTLRDDLEDMIACATGLGIRTRVITNGFNLDRARIQRLKDCGLEELMISLDGFQETQNRFRGSPRAYERTMRTIAGSLEVGLRTRVSMVAYRENRDEVVPLMLEMDRLGVHVFSVFLGSPLGRAARSRMDSVLTAPEWREACRELQDAVRQHAVRMQVIHEQGFQYAEGPPVDRSALHGRGTGCATLMKDFDFLILRADGNLYQCVFFVPDGQPLGNVASTSLRGALAEARRAALYQPFTVAHDRCVDCGFQAACGTGCRGYAYAYTGDWLKTDPRCPKTNGEMPPYFPLCPILKANAGTGCFGGSSEQALEG